MDWYLVPNLVAGVLHCILAIFCSVGVPDEFKAGRTGEGMAWLAATAFFWATGFLLLRTLA